MSVYSIGFSEKLIDAARAVVQQDDSFDAGRTVIYLSLLSCEITLKALLEKAGKPVSQIKKLSHDLAAMLLELSKCKVEVEIAKDFSRWVLATRIRGKTVDKRFRDATVGKLLSAEADGCSKYPNEIRYGDRIFHYPPELMLKTAVCVVEWAKEHWESIRI